ncbi:NAC domain-containing protein 7 [Sesamum alatum]|uniref:NAC domain-containing protein 7 n=1 Tax=Sesamum alatum TaxID=300844 RepID=A0AAE1YLA7_9LAMI|nr:NAC domain-containing protein 7 [Sesamum alatum]
MDSPKQQHSLPYNYPNYTSCKKEMDLQYGIPPDHFLQLPLLESPKIMQPLPSYGPGPGLNLNPNPNPLSQDIHQTIDHNFHSMFRNSDQQSGDHQVTDWRVLDKFVASQLSQEEISKENDTFPANEESNLIARNLMNKQQMAAENASTSSSSCQIDLWK